MDIRFTHVSGYLRVATEQSTVSSVFLTLWCRHRVGGSVQTALPSPAVSCQQYYKNCVITITHNLSLLNAISCSYQLSVVFTEHMLLFCYHRCCCRHVSDKINRIWHKLPNTFLLFLTMSSKIVQNYKNAFPNNNRKNTIFGFILKKFEPRCKLLYFDLEQFK